MPLVYHSDTPGHGARLFPLSSALALGYFSARLLKSSASPALRSPGSWYLVRRSAPPLLGFFGALRVPCYAPPMLTARLLHSSTAPVLGLRSLPLDDLRRSAPSRTVPVLGRSSALFTILSFHRSDSPALGDPSAWSLWSRILCCLTFPALGGSALFRSSSLDPTRSWSAQLSVSLVLGYPDAPPVQCAILGWWAVLALGSSGTIGEIRRFLLTFICCCCCCCRHCYCVHASAVAAYCCYHRHSCHC